MTLLCPSCGLPNRVAKGVPGATVRCRCGQELPVPLAAPVPRVGLFGALALLVGASLAVGIPVLGWALLPEATAFEERARLGEARPHLRALCEAVSAEHERSGAWVAAGPVPLLPPAGARPIAFVPGPHFERLGFLPGQVRLSYQVEVDDAGVRCVARGDLDADGLTSRFELPLDADGGLSLVRVTNERE